MMKRILDILKLRWQTLTRRSAIEADLDEELRFHLESVTAGYIRQGLSPREAAARARRDFGGVEQIKEQARDTRGLGWLEDLAADLHYALRTFRHAPAFALTAILTVALGIGFNAGLFSLLYSLMVRPVPVPHSAGLVNVYMATRGDGPRATYGFPTFVSWPEFRYFQRSSKTMDIAAVHEALLTWKGHEKTRVQAQLVSDNLLPLLGAAPAQGRFFHPEETATVGQGQVVVLSHHAWRSWFGADPAIVGRPMILNRTLFTIIGVTRENFRGPLIRVADLWIPLTMQKITRPDEAMIENDNAAFIQMFARPRPGFSRPELEAEARVLGPQSLRPHAPRRTVSHISTPPASFMNNPMFRDQALPVIAVLFLAVTLILLVACANVANLLLARGLARRREIAIRLAIGAGRGRILRQMLTESILLSLAGGALGLLLGQAAAHLFIASLPAAEVGIIQLDLSPDLRILAYAFCVSLLTGVIFGLAPLLQAWRTDLQIALKTEGLVAESRRQRFWLQHGLVAAQVAVCLVLLVSAGLLLRGWQKANTLGSGIATRGVLTASPNLRQQQFSPAAAQAFLQNLRDRAATLGPVQAATLTSLLPYDGRCTSVARLLDAQGAPGPEFLYGCESIGQDFLAVTGLELRRGRSFTRPELLNPAKLALIDEDFERRYLPGRDPLGQRIRLGDSAADDHLIIGVVSSRRFLQPFGDEHFGMLYTPLANTRWLETQLMVKYTGPRRDVESALEALAREIDGDVALGLRPIEELYASTLMPVTLSATLASTLGLLALLMATTGIFGVVSFALSRRLKEVGIRLALGAGRATILRLLLRQSLTPVLLGAAVGLLLAAAAAQLLRSFLFGLSPLDPVSFGGMALLLLLAAIIAAWIPARRALRLDPMVTLRHE